VLKLHQKHNILTAAYGPLTPILRHPSGGPLKPVLNRIANRISKDNTDLPISIDEIAVLLLWHRAQGVLAVTASGTPDNIRRLAAIGQLPNGLITKEEVEEINSVGSKIHFRHYVRTLSDSSYHWSDD
jgi:diketogulonate reductase-like aldo/keto reductase